MSSVDFSGWELVRDIAWPELATFRDERDDVMATAIFHSVRVSLSLLFDLRAVSLQPPVVTIEL